jgi:hypothetical protein
MRKLTGWKNALVAGITLSAFAATAGTARSAVITNPTLTSGADAIDPPATAYNVDVSYTPSNATPQSTLEGLSGFGAINGWHDADSNKFAAGTNYVNFTDSALPDIRFTFSGNYAGTAGTEYSSPSFATSPQKFVALYGTASTTMGMQIDFGTYDTTHSTFTAGNAPVRAAGFTVPHINIGDVVTVTFNSGSTTLSTQTADATDAAITAAYFGWDAGATATSSSAISSIVISMARGAGSTQTGFDDLGFTQAVPEPASIALLSLGGLTLLARRRRAWNASRGYPRATDAAPHRPPPCHGHLARGLRYARRHRTGTPERFSKSEAFLWPDRRRTLCCC